MSSLRTDSSQGAMRDWGQMMAVSCTIWGTPFSSRKEVRASPVPRFMMTSSVRKAGLGRKVDAAARTAFCSAGV